MAFARTVESHDTVVHEIRAAASLTEERLSAFFAGERAARADLDARACDPVDLLERLALGGGKRLRPAFCHWGHRAVTGDADPPVAVVDVGAALELLHSFALAHDDVMDESATRRGAETTHVAQAALHQRSGWSGSAGRYGESIAMLVGDLGHTYARRLLRGAPSPVVELWDELEVELVIGQYLDVRGTASREVPLRRAMRIAELKSGRYTVMRPLALGAALGGRRATPAGLEEYGLAVGVAFQLRDDLLGVFGSSDVTGKPAGDDLREGKPTPLVALARDRATPAELAVLDAVGTPEVDVDRVRSVLHDTCAAAEVERRIERLTEQGTAALFAHDGEIHPPTARLLADVAEFLQARAT